MTKILIIGSKGMAGHIIRQYIMSDSQYEVIDIARDNYGFKPTYTLDITDFNSVKNIIESTRPQYVINCIGILNNDAETNPDKAILLNSYLPHHLARLCTTYLAKLIHISTDCVFNGQKGSYIENDAKDGIGFYAQSKALGEVSYFNHLTIRTSIVGPELKTEGIGLFNWFMKQEGTVNGYTNAFWSGITTLELSKVIKQILDLNISGIYHVTNGEKISKCELLELFKKHSNKNIFISPIQGKDVDKSLLDTRKEIPFKIPTYDIMIKELSDFVKNNLNLYPHYLKAFNI